jgi:hypothetical protein
MARRSRHEILSQLRTKRTSPPRRLEVMGSTPFSPDTGRVSRRGVRRNEDSMLLRACWQNSDRQDRRMQNGVGGRWQSRAPPVTYKMDSLGDADPGGPSGPILGLDHRDHACISTGTSSFRPLMQCHKALVPDLCISSTLKRDGKRECDVMGRKRVGDWSHQYLGNLADTLRAAPRQVSICLAARKLISFYCAKVKLRY